MFYPAATRALAGSLWPAPTRCSTAAGWGSSLKTAHDRWQTM